LVSFYFRSVRDGWSLTAPPPVRSPPGTLLWGTSTPILSTAKLTLYSFYKPFPFVTFFQVLGLSHFRKGSHRSRLASTPPLIVASARFPSILSRPENLRSSRFYLLLPRFFGHTGLPPPSPGSSKRALLSCPVNKRETLLGVPSFAPADLCLLRMLGGDIFLAGDPVVAFFLGVGPFLLRLFYYRVPFLVGSPGFVQLLATPRLR